MYYTYILISLSNPERFYIGSISDLNRRLLEHNSGKPIHTNKFTPWKIKNYIAFEMQEQAEKFERFLRGSFLKSILNLQTSKTSEPFCKNIIFLTF